MWRPLRWQYYSRRQRQIALGLLTASAASCSAGLTAWHALRPLRADSGARTDSNSWNSKATVVTSNTSSKSIGKTQKPPRQTKGHKTLHQDGEIPREATERVADDSDKSTGWDFSAIQQMITDSIVPAWVRVLPRYVDKLRDELSGAPQSLSWECWEDAHDPESNPEILWDASVRISKDLCDEELQFLQQRRKHTTKSLARYLGVSEADVHPDDVPVIGLCGSGGGLRALVAGAASSLCAQESGLLDCVTYTAGVSGSCWLQALYHSSIGQQDLSRVIKHLKQRIGVHIAYPPSALSLLSQAPTNKFLLKGFIEKLRGVPDGDIGLVDVYGILLASRLLVPKGELNVTESDLKVSSQQDWVQGGVAPLPIYTAVRHEIPKEIEGHVGPSQAAWHNTRHYDWFQWFEWTPYEFFCEELETGIPTWALGRKFDGGNIVWRDNGLALPELRVPLLMGVWGSAFCATLSHYYKEVRPLLRTAGLNKLDSMLSGKGDDLAKFHPVDPAVIPNFMLGLRDRLPETTPDSIHETSHLQLMDAGMSNNLPIYPLLRPGRNVDIVIAFDASADVRGDNWIQVVDGYARQRGIKGWPMGAGWPVKSTEAGQAIEEIDQAQAAIAEKIDSSQPQPETTEIGHCNVWVGSTQERTEYMEDAPGHRIMGKEDEWRISSEDAGLSLIYLPFLPNDKVEGVDPMTSDFMSTWNFIYTPEEVDKVVNLAKANFEAGREQIRRTIKAVWQRKRDLRLGREKDEKEVQRIYRTRKQGDASQWDHRFSAS